ncbi:MAG: hypothetical protein JO089_00670 [Alphaproteobacteria bacterium]|nr:hypothetical protein [Alphaproteobacteria bacterium]
MTRVNAVTVIASAAKQSSVTVIASAAKQSSVTVIASAAKQSSEYIIDCFVALLLAMTRGKNASTHTTALAP